MSRKKGRKCVAVILIVSPLAALLMAYRNVVDDPSSAVEVTVHVVAVLGKAVQRITMLRVSRYREANGRAYREIRRSLHWFEGAFNVIAPLWGNDLPLLRFRVRRCPGSSFRNHRTHATIETTPHVTVPYTRTRPGPTFSQAAVERALARSSCGSESIRFSSSAAATRRRVFKYS